MPETGNTTSGRILIAEDHALVRQGLAALVSEFCTHIVEVADGVSALAALKSDPFDIALLDIGLPGITGLDILRDVRKRALPIKVIILTGDTHTHAPAEIYDAGADAFLYKTTDAETLIQTIQAVASEDMPPPIGLETEEEISAPAQLREKLTARERQVLKLVVEGQSNRKIAEVLAISEHTVRKHREHINRKLAAHTPAALAAFAIRAGLV